MEREDLRNGSKSLGTMTSAVFINDCLHKVIINISFFNFCH